MTKLAVTQQIDGARVVTLAQVEDAFYALMTGIEGKVDGDTMWVIDSAREDVLYILAGRPLEHEQGGNRARRSDVDRLPF